MKKYHQIKLKFFSLIYISFLFIDIYAQKVPIKFGEINKEDLEMKVYPLDTTASSAILCNYGYFNVNQLQFVQTIRIKIFKKEGTYWGNHMFPSYLGTHVKGITFNLENNKIIESKLKSESIFEEKLTQYRSRTRVAMPNVKEGSIIDIEFVMPYSIPYEWRFQEDVPVRWSELVIENNSYVFFFINLSGFEPLSEISKTRWVAKNMPAFKKEPYMHDMVNYITKLNIEHMGRKVTWAAINQSLMEDNYFGLAMEGSMYLNKTVKEIENKYTNPLDKVKAAYEAVKLVKWNERSSLFASEIPLSLTYNKKIGNSAQINMILIQLLRKLNFETEPLALSTRENGFLPLTNPTVNGFNYLVAYTKVNNKKLILDATEELMPLGLIPNRCMNLRGRVIDDKSGYWVDIETDKKNKKTVQYDLKLQPDFQLTGSIKYKRFDYAAFDFRKEYEKFNDKEEYLKNFEKTHNNLSIIDFNIQNKDSIYLPLEDKYEIKIKNMVTISDSLLNINPMMYERMLENPFKIEERKYPIDFTYPQEITYLFKLTLPKVFKVAELPKPLVIRLPDNSISCMYQISNFENVVQLTYKLSINKPIFNELEYSNIRGFFNEVIKKQSETIVLKAAQ